MESRVIVSLINAHVMEVHLFTIKNYLLISSYIVIVVIGVQYSKVNKI